MKLIKHVLNTLIIVFACLRLINYFYKSTVLQIISAAVALIIIVYSIPKASLSMRVVLLTMLGAGAALLILSRADASVWLSAILQNGNVATLLICVPLISMPFYYEDYQSELKKLAQIRMQGLLSFLILVTICTHFLSAIMSVGAMFIIYNLMRPFGKLYSADKPFLTTLTRSYASSGFWSPAWASVIVFSAYPDVSWLRLVPIGIGMAVLYNVLHLGGVSLEMRRFPGRYPNIQPEEGTRLNKKMLYTMLILAVTMIAAIIVLNAATGWDLLLVVPLISIIFPIVVALCLKQGPAFKRELHAFYNVSLATVRSQVTLFTLAGFLGKALEVAGVGQFLSGIVPPWLRQFPILTIIAILLIMILPSQIGVHPAATGTAIVASFIPSAMGLSHYTFALTVQLGWLLTILVAPFSATAIMLGGAENKSSYAMSVGLNWKFCAVCLILFSLLISFIGPLLG